MYLKVYFQLKEKMIKENESKESDNEFIKFTEMIKKIGASAKNFVASLIGLKMKKTISQEIIDVCFKYHQLLKSTTYGFSDYGADIHKLQGCMSQISYHFLLPASIKNELDQLDSESKKKAINKLREQTSEGLKSSSKDFNTLLNEIDKKHVPKLKELSEEWSNLDEKIVGLLKVLADYKTETNKNKGYKKNVNDTLDGLGQVAKFAGGFCLKYIAAPLTFGVPAAIGAGIVCAISLCNDAAADGAAGTKAGALLFAAGVAGTVMIAANTASGGNFIKKARKKAQEWCDKGDDMMAEVIAAQSNGKQSKQEIKQIEIMKEALERMAKVAAQMSIAIFSEVGNINTIKEFNPHDAINGGGGYGVCDVMFMNNDILAKIQQLGKSILNCTTCLEKSRQNIKSVQTVCKEEMNSFRENVHEPLIRMVSA